MKYTIREISDLAHVAPSTVSKALNGQSGVSEKKRAEIIRLASEHNYIPNASARALSHRTTETVGLIIPTGEERSLLGSYWSEIIAAIAEEVNRRNYSLLLIVPNSEKRLEGLKQTILRQNVDGFIIPAEEMSSQASRMLEDFGTPYVILGRTRVSEHFSVDVQNESGAVMLTKELFDRGFRNCACVAGPEELLYSKERVSGFAKFMAENGNANSPVLYTLYSEEKALSDIRSFLEQNPAIDSLFITAGGEFSFYVLKVLNEMGKDMEHFGISVFDDYTPLHFLPFPVITASQPIRQLGLQAARNLFQLLSGEEPPAISLFDIAIIK